MSLGAGDGAKMGSTVVRGETEAAVEFTGAATFFGKTATMLQAGDELGNLQKTLLRARAPPPPLLFTPLFFCCRRPPPAAS